MIEELLRKAHTAQRIGDRGAARAHLEAALAVTPDHPAALNSLGVLTLTDGDIAASIELHRRATVADPDAPVLWMNLAKAQREAGDDDGEANSLDAVLGLDAVYFPALVRKAELCERRGDRAEALRLWQGVIATAPQTGGLDEILAHAHEFVRAQTDHFAETVDAGLAEARHRASGSLRRFDAAVGFATGRRKLFTNECAGFHYPFLPADEFFERSHFPWLCELEAATPAIRAELESLLETGTPGFAPYVQMAPGTPENKWTTLDGQMEWGAYYLWHYGKPVADAHVRCPQTVAALAAVPQLHLKGRCPSAFFSILQPGARIPPHTGVTNIRTIIHLPLIVPDGCGFRVGGETREWREGEAFAFDDTIEHEAWNESAQLRAVLILDVWNPHIDEDERILVQRFFDVSDEAGLGTGAAEAF
jgi:aspartate beta-hydroxylase